MHKILWFHHLLLQRLIDQFHGRLEFASINQMEKAVDIYKEIIKLNANKKTN